MFWASQQHKKDPPFLFKLSVCVFRSRPRCAFSLAAQEFKFVKVLKTKWKFGLIDQGFHLESSCAWLFGSHFCLPALKNTCIFPFVGHRIEFKFIKFWPNKVEWEQLPNNQNRIHYIRYESIYLDSVWNEPFGKEIVIKKFLSSFNLLHCNVLLPPLPDLRCTARKSVARLSAVNYSSCRHQQHSPIPAY